MLHKKTNGPSKRQDKSAQKKARRVRVKAERFEAERKEIVPNTQDARVHTKKRVDCEGLKGTIPTKGSIEGYEKLSKGTVVIKDGSWQQVDGDKEHGAVLVVNFRPFEEMEAEERKEYDQLMEDLQKLEKGTNPVKLNGAHKKGGQKGNMWAIGWRAGFKPGESLGNYTPRKAVRDKENGLEEWKEQQENERKRVATMFQKRFKALSPKIYNRTVEEAEEFGVPSLGEMDFNNMEVEEPFASNLTLTKDEFSNTFHVDRDVNTYTFGIWAPLWKESAKLATNADGFHSTGGHFVVPNYKVCIDFNRCDGVVEIIWRGGHDYHATMESKTVEGFTRIGTSVQIAKGLYSRVKKLKELKADGEEVNGKIGSVDSVVKSYGQM